MNEFKKEVRLRNIEVRSSLDRERQAELSKKVTLKLIQLSEYKMATSIHTYVPIEKNREIDTTILIEDALEKGKKVNLPKMQSSGEMSHHQIDSLNSLVKNRWGVPEPETTEEADLSDCSLIIVPMVAGDFDRNRLGYGKGYYDRFLNSMQAARIGLCYSFNLQWNSLSVESFDEKMDIILTENLIVE